MMTEKYRLFVVPHTHWDREWYGSFQLFRLRLVRLMNKLLNILEHDPTYKTFNLDGQTIILEDYLEVHPEQREKLLQFITEGRLMVGPWYILPDEFLTSGESLVRNLLLGKKISQEFGHRMDVGYIPDTFGHIAQLPQILNGFGLDTCMNFRGLDSGGRQSELWWESPDGSRVLLHHMSTEIGYSDLGAMASDQQRAAYDLRATAYYKAERATGEVLLAMQGVDHVEARADLPMIIGIANDTFDDIEFVQASLEDFWTVLKQSIDGKELETVYGELRDVPHTEGSMNILLYNVLSSRADNKLQNARTLNALEKWADPWCTLAAMWGIEPYPQGHLWTAWKWLLKNHPHDSIGGCSVDEVHRQMATRFEWANEIADYLTEERFRLIADQTDHSEAHDDDLAVMLFNASPWDRDEIVTVDIDLPEYWLRQQALAHYTPPKQVDADSHYLDVKDVNTRADWLYGMPELPEVFFRSIQVRSSDGDLIPVQIHNIEKTTTAIALASGPRGVMDIRRVRASFRANVPAFGYSSYYVKTDSRPSRWQREKKDTPVYMMDNGHLRVTVHSNGTFDLTMYQSERLFEGLGLLEDSGDNGDGYTFSPPQFNRAYTSHGSAPRIAYVGNGVGVQHIRIEHELQLPVGLDDSRQYRQETLTTCSVTIDLMLADGSERLDIAITVDNRAKDHRMRILFPTGLTDIQEATSAMQFDAVTRPIKPEPIAPDGWWVENPPDTFPMHGWVDVANQYGLCAITEGIYEFAVDQPATLALTLLRAVGYLGARRDPTTIIGGAGPGIPTPEAQLQTRLTYRLALYPHEGKWDEANVWKQSHDFQTPMRSLTVVPQSRPDGKLSVMQGIRLEGDHVVLSTMKQSEDGQGIIIRLFNPTDSDTSATLFFPETMPAIERAYLANLDETPIAELTLTSGHQLEVPLKAKKIITLRLDYAD